MTGGLDSKAIVDRICVFAFGALLVYRVVTSLAGPFEHSILTYIAVAWLAAVLADFFSGLGHWTLDTWGSNQTFLIGGLIFSFREHHKYPKRILIHDFYNRNGEGCALALVGNFLFSFIFPRAQWPLINMLLLLLGLGVALTNEVHMYSHSDDPQDIPAFVQFLQRYNIILSQKHHQLHHNAHLSHYCIFTGWLNEPLDKIDFWRRAEAKISKLTGWVPRGEDEEFNKNIDQDKIIH
mmetsp:Transcript_15088/g.25944  ORF Transcript_15088/g.25944 Transcript_15088/m.25944 type:complete len:237 (-) Transcript_15088:56-766(-)